MYIRSRVTLLETLISNNSSNGIRVSNGLTTISGNNLFGNGQYEIFNDMSGDITAINNWWGTTNISEIEVKIYDYYDDITRGEVTFQPFALSPFPTPEGALIALFTATPLSGNAPLTVSFTDQSIGDPTSWLWNFGDSQTSTEQNPTHIYASAGTYTVSLTVSNASGSDTMTRTNYITVNPSTVATLELTIVDKDTRQPLNAASIELFKWNEGLNEWEIYRQAQTDVNGQYASGDLEGGDYVVRAYKKGTNGKSEWFEYYPEWYNNVPGSMNKINNATSIHLEPGGSIEATHDLNKVPVKVEISYRNNRISSAGGDFSYSVVIENRTNQSLSLKRWVTVKGSSPWDMSTDFQQGNIIPFTLSPFQRIVPKSHLILPANAPDGEYGITAFVGASANSPWEAINSASCSLYKGTP
ncbi:MAG: PKD domain-containing protein [Pseudomonadota bacterium]